LYILGVWGAFVEVYILPGVPEALFFYYAIVMPYNYIYSVAVLKNNPSGHAIAACPQCWLPAEAGQWGSSAPQSVIWQIQMGNLQTK